MQYGDKKKIATYEVAEKMGKKTPLNFMPNLDIILEWYCEKYILLRNSSNFNGRIPASEILSFICMNTIYDTPEEFYRIITSIDVEINSIKDKEDGRNSN